MSDTFEMSISIPSDDDGYVLMQCPNCGTYFKATPLDIEDDGVLQVYCPSCGLVGENYITEDVLELAKASGAFLFPAGTQHFPELQYHTLPLSARKHFRAVPL